MKNNQKKINIILDEFGHDKFFSISADRSRISLMAGFDSKLNSKLHNNPKWSAELCVESNWIEFKRFDICITICLDL
jgi:hypothetical protein